MATLGQRISNRSNPDYKVRYRSLEINVENLTDFKLEFLGDYFETGVWHENPGHHVLEAHTSQEYIVTSKMGGFLVGVTGVIKYRVVGAGCFLFLCFSAPVVGGYRTKVALHAKDYPAGTEYQDLQMDRFTAVKYKDLVASVEMLESGIGCKKQFMYRLSLQQSIAREPEKKIGKEDATDGKNLKDTKISSIGELSPPPPPPPPPLPPALPSSATTLPPKSPDQGSSRVEAPPPNTHKTTTAETPSVTAPQSSVNLHESINSQILAGVKLRSVSNSPAMDREGQKFEEENNLVKIISEVMDQRRTRIESDSDWSD